MSRLAALLGRKRPAYIDPLVAAGDKVATALSVFEDAAAHLDEAVTRFQQVEAGALSAAKAAADRAADARTQADHASTVLGRLQALTAAS